MNKIALLEEIVSRSNLPQRHKHTGLLTTTLFSVLISLFPRMALPQDAIDDVDKESYPIVLQSEPIQMSFGAAHSFQFFPLISEICYVSLAKAIVPDYEELRISRSFYNGKTSSHGGIDIDGINGLDVTALADGIIAYKGWIDRLGWTVMYTDAFGYLHITGHQSEESIKNLHIGQKLFRGEKYAEISNSGDPKIKSDGSHVHYAVVPPENYTLRENLPPIFRFGRISDSAINPLGYWADKIVSGARDIDQVSGERVAFIYVPPQNYPSRKGPRNNLLIVNPFDDDGHYSHMLRFPATRENLQTLFGRDLFRKYTFILGHPQNRIFGQSFERNHLLD